VPMPRPSVASFRAAKSSAGGSIWRAIAWGCDDCERVGYAGAVRWQTGLTGKGAGPKPAWLAGQPTATPQGMALGDCKKRPGWLGRGQPPQRTGLDPCGPLAILPPPKTLQAPECASRFVASSPTACFSTASPRSMSRVATFPLPPRVFSAPA
jgi:hypothetical protein